MTEYSYVWRGTAQGDATLAPYNTLGPFWAFTLGANTQYTGFVIPGQLNELKVLQSGGRSVGVSSGYAHFREYFYVNDASVPLAVAENTSGSVRYDYVVLEVNKAAKTVRAKIVQGTAGSGVPTLTRTATTYQQPLALLYLPSGYSAIYQHYIYDTRRFFQPRIYGYEEKENLIRNSEFLAFSGSATDPPDYWELVGSPTSITRHTQNWWGSYRARPLIIQANAGAGVKQRIYLPEHTTNYALYGSVDIASGTRDRVRVSIGTNVQFAGDKDLPILFYFSTDDPYVDLEIKSRENGLTFYVGQFILIPGHFPGNFRSFKELLGFNFPVTDAAWTGTAKSTSTTTITLGSAGSFNGKILEGTRSILFRLRANDSGSAAAATCRLFARHINANLVTVICELAGVVNDTARDVTGMIDLESFDNPQFIAGVTASGPNTLDATIEITGILT